MANQEQLNLLKQGRDVWNTWRKQYPSLRSDLSGANLSGADLSFATQGGAILREVFDWGTDLSEANLSGAELERVELSGADLSGANLSGALQLHFLIQQESSQRKQKASPRYVCYWIPR